MEGEQSIRNEAVPPGRLYFLSHPACEIFSGYGISAHSGRNDHLLGLLMVDRPSPVDPTWLAEIEDNFGFYQLVPMTQTGERGLLAHLHVPDESLGYLEAGRHPMAQHIEQALQPLLVQPPAPMLEVRWDSQKKLWTSEFWRGLPLVLQRLFVDQGPGCLALEREGQVAFVSHVHDKEIASFRQARVQARWELITMETAPLIRFRAALLDRADDPYVIEHFLNVADPEQVRCLTGLIEQEALFFDFFGSDFAYAYTTTLQHTEELRRSLVAIVHQAVEYYGRLAPAQRDFDRAKDTFQRRFPI